MRGGEWEPPLVACESHVRLEEGLSSVGDAGVAEVRRKPWWGEAVGGDVVHTCQEGLWHVQWTLRLVGSSKEHDDCRWARRTPANPLVRHVLYENRPRSVDLDPKILTNKTIQNTHKTRGKETR
jgi:hypothetical protein